jgi:hypothetical protein
VKTTTIEIPGFSYDSTPENKPAICVFGEENVGKSRFGCTAPHEGGVIGWLAMDKNSKSAVDRFKRAHKANWIVVNQKPFVTHAQAVKMAMNDKPAEAKAFYREVVGRIFDAGMALAENQNVESIVVDDGSWFFDAILFSHFGRRNQIESFLRGVPNNDFIDFVTALGSKNLVMVARGTDLWADTGEVDDKGKKKQAPTGRLKPEGFGKIGKFMTAVVELTATRKKPVSDDTQEALKAKYHCRIVTCKGDTLLEGQDLDAYGISGEDITWDNLMTVMNAKEE